MTDPTRPTDPTQPAPAGNPFSTPAGTPAPGASPFASPAAPPPATAPVPVAPVKRRSSAGLLVNVLLGVAVVVAVGGVAFAAGRATAPTTTAANGRFGGNGAGGFGPNASGAPGRGGAFQGVFGGGGVTVEGTVTAVAADSITIQLSSGQAVTIPTSSDTTYHSQTAASSSDVTTGATVKVELSGGGRFAGGGQGTGGNGNGGNAPTASGAPGRGLGSASSVTVVPAGS